MSAEMRTSQLATGTASPAVAGENIVVTYRGRTVVDVESVAVPAGSTYVLLGASGAGKSTLLRVLGLLEKPTSGSVLVGGAPADWRNLAVRRQIAAVFQKPYLLRGSVADNIHYGLALRGVSRSDAKQRVSAVLARVGMNGWEDRSALTLSGGEAQRVALARALVLEPRLLLLDEPLSYLDPLLKRSLTREFAEILAGEHVTTLYVTHDQEEAAVVADRIGIMRAGHIVAEGEPDAVLTLPSDEWVAAFVGTETPFDGVVASAEDGLMRIDCGGQDIFAAGDMEVGTRVVAGVRPEDVVLFETGVTLPLTSARNQLEGVVAEVAPDGAMVRVVIERGSVRVSSRVSRLSAEALGLHPGVSVVVLFKASAVGVRRA